MFNRREEEKQRLKLKMELYGSYTREIEHKQRRYFEIEQEIQMNENIQRAAKNLGVYSDDPYRPADKQLLHEYHSIEDEIKTLELERSYLGLDEFLEKLGAKEKIIMMKLYVDKLTYAEISRQREIDYSASTCYRVVKKIFEIETAFH